MAGKAKAPDRIVSGDDIARRDALRNYREWIEVMAIRFSYPYVGTIDNAAPKVDAFIDFGRWCGRCPYCNASEYVEPNDPVFFCLHCGNEDVDGKLLKVTFPRYREGIENALLRRPVVPGRGAHISQRAMNARPKLPGMGICWNCTHPSHLKAKTLGEVKSQNREHGLPEE